MSERTNRARKALLIADAAIRGIRSARPTGAEIRQQAALLVASEDGFGELARAINPLWKGASDKTAGLVVTILRQRAIDADRIRVVEVPTNVQQLYAFATSEGNESLAQACVMLLNGSTDETVVRYVSAALQLRALQARAA